VRFYRVPIEVHALVQNDELGLTCHLYHLANENRYEPFRVTVRELADAFGLTKYRAHRLITSLVDAGYLSVETSQRHGTWVSIEWPDRLPDNLPDTAVEDEPEKIGGGQPAAGQAPGHPYLVLDYDLDYEQQRAGARESASEPAFELTSPPPKPKVKRKSRKHPRLMEALDLWNQAAARQRSRLVAHGEDGKIEGKGPLGSLNRTLHKLTDEQVEGLMSWFKMLLRASMDEVGWWHERTLTVSSAIRMEKLLTVHIPKARAWAEGGSRRHANVSNYGRDEPIDWEARAEQQWESP